MSRHARAVLVLAIAFGWFGAVPLAQAACTVASTGVAFGVYSPASATALQGTGTVSVTCDNYLVSVQVQLDDGGAGGFANRYMNSGIEKLFYQLYTDSGYTTIFGDGTNGTSDVTCLTGWTSGGCSGIFSLTATQRMYGLVPAGQNVAVGSYSDTIRVAITF
ncbi:spore coat U domain-containing protein [Lysobacter sp. KIS68-7]|uniref:Csu type fimbrial protein n=1 Tax=Lysobacter sp. KIS68-7 TaxID=2904252 RepID=UPI001E63A617|nr:spore coat U domain-containing protein [Lysobacter sp. KIS68-7]UHQ18736.1 spore coat U domain-containing protein [Lysobacter sp. KIS68-7]